MSATEVIKVLPEAASVAVDIAKSHPVAAMVVAGATVTTIAVSGIWAACHYGRSFSIKFGSVEAAVKP